MDQDSQMNHGPTPNVVKSSDVATVFLPRRLKVSSCSGVLCSQVIEMGDVGSGGGDNDDSAVSW